MAATIMDGKTLAMSIKTGIAEAAFYMAHKPTLAVVLVGDDPASAIYVRNKEKDCAECGIQCRDYRLAASTSQAELLRLIEQLNRDISVDGILVQLPLPKGLNTDEVLCAIDPDKDVDCFHPFNVGRLWQGGGVYVPCTPAGAMALLQEYHIDPAGKQCVIIGRSNIVGKPMAALLLQAHGTVTVCHSRTENLKELCRKADILVAAAGQKGLVTADMVKPGAVVIDVSMNRGEDGHLCGDADFEAVSEIASFITPVPGGVGPMTRAMLMVNTLTAARRHH